MRDGERVWYEAAPGIRFAGVVVGPGTLRDTLRIRLTPHYWRWKGEGAPSGGRSQPAVATSHLYERDTDAGYLDVAPTVASQLAGVEVHDDDGDAL